MSDFPVIRTPRLILRELCPADVPALFAIHSDADAMQWFGTDPITDYPQAEQLLALFASWRSLPNPGTRWAIERHNQPGLLGTCGLFKWNRQWRSCAVGFELGRAAQGQGLMTEALEAVVGWGFEHMALNRIEAQVHPRNLASLRLLERAGFVREGLSRQAGYWLGTHHDLVQYGLLRADWLSLAPLAAGSA
ncbi:MULTISPECIES: GNAT family N-acetyltransferase [Pseudomonas]|jgi:ribosomal-protein-alanine N-acetyltransferase|uniref:GNAT family N-acetyltransferase n=1 Tax=Pseudomonas TaxID=286 RepID=UPI0013725B1C|nr:MULTISPECIES: GNAT family protein [Pseudomonas]MBF0641170.1 GNAT family N-acetyltransferase [Pseudomonas protegens]MBP5106053.1 GNAT family N-acetyltransferase [Pseudomonas protegens]MBP5129982.1 GNAT family N-acetyltransferase [Pseudomonas protegens]MBP5147404.1 GNAT family N-acetyltransferase [Pseudomonas protegens]NAN53872.1 N-acetyltransferase [Pseudomonas protegens]